MCGVEVENGKELSESCSNDFRDIAFGPITSCQIERKAVETVTDFIFLGSKIIASDDCSHEIKRRLPLGRKAMSNLDSVLKSRDINLPTEIWIVKAMVFSKVMNVSES